MDSYTLYYLPDQVVLEVMRAEIEGARVPFQA